MILYFGNILSGHGYSRTTIEYLGPRLKLYNDVMMLSSHKNILFRYLTMCFVLVLNIRKTKLILIDTYSSNAFYYALSIGLLSKLFQIPFIPILHGSGLPKRYQTSTAPINSLLKNSAINVTPSLFLKKQFRKHKVLTCYIPNTIDIENYRFKPRKFITPKLLWVRSFHKIYNPKMAIKVLHGVLV